MLPQNPLLQLTLMRVKNTRDQVARAIWQPLSSAFIQIAFVGNQPEFIPLDEIRDKPRQLIQPPFHWGKLYDHAWFHIHFKEPTQQGDYFYWNDCGEGTAYIDGIPYAGYDTCHKQWKLPAGTSSLWMECLCLQRGVWGGQQQGLTPQGSLLEDARLQRRDEAAWNAFHDLDLLYSLALDEAARHEGEPRNASGPGYKPPLDHVSYLQRRLYRHLDDACNAWDTEGVQGVQRVLTETYHALRSTDPKLTAVLTGHAHIDLVWLWTEACGEYKAVHTFASQNRLLEIYPEFRFGYSQSASYEAVARRAPDLMRAVQEKIERGVWETPGVTYVESDTLLACGEALARGFEVGREAFAEVGDDRSRVLWLPDVFGYSGCLPQIMKESGVDFFFTTKLSWKTVTRFPYSSFIWRGIDGSEVIAQLNMRSDYNGQAEVEQIRNEAEAYRQGDLHDQYLLPTGYGDGGGGPTPEICERVRRLQSLIDVPHVKWGSIADFFEGLEKIQHQLPAYQGELYFEYHRGIYTTHHTLKAVFRAAERALQSLEAVHCAMDRGPIDVAPWKRVIFAQFHDYIPGSSVKEVYEQAIPELSGIVGNLQREAKRKLEANGTECLFNPLPQPVTHAMPEGLLTIPPLTGVRIDSARHTKAPLLEASKSCLSNGIVRATFNGKGLIASLVVDGRTVQLTQPSGEIWAYPDNPHRYEAWDIDRQTLSLGKPVGGSVISSGHHRSETEATLSFEQKIGRDSSLVTHYRVKAGSRLLEIEYELDWREEALLLKSQFHTAYLGRHARYGSPFGSVRRPQQAGGPAEEAMFEVPGSRWGMVTDDNESEGLFLVTEDLYGFSCRNGHLGLSLIRAAKLPWVEADAAINRHPTTTRYTDTGDRHRLRFAVGYYHSNLTREVQPAAVAESLFTEPVAYRGEPMQTGFLGLEGGDSLQPVWAKPAKEGNKVWVLRLHETLGRAGECQIILRDGFEAYVSDLQETRHAQIPSGTFTFRAYQIISLLIGNA